MSALDVIANSSHGWNRDPSGVVFGTERIGISAALWKYDGDDVQEVGSEANPGHLLIGYQLNRFQAEIFYDDQPLFAGSHGNGSFNIVPAGVRPRAWIKGRFECLHIYLPISTVAAVVEDIGHENGRIEFINPKAAVDPQVKRIAGDVLAEMQRELQIPISFGQAFRDEVGHDSDQSPATVPR
jgi:hypothetical protein